MFQYKEWVWLTVSLLVIGFCPAAVRLHLFLPRFVTSVCVCVCVCVLNKCVKRDNKGSTLPVWVGWLTVRREAKRGRYLLWFGFALIRCPLCFQALVALLSEVNILPMKQDELQPGWRKGAVRNEKKRKKNRGTNSVKTHNKLWENTRSITERQTELQLGALAASLGVDADWEGGDMK